MNNSILARVPIDQIEVNERFRIEYGNIQELVHSYKKHSFFGAIVLYKNPDGSVKPYRLVAGGRRLKAAELSGMTEISASIYTRELTELELRQLELDENLYRKELTWQENYKLTAHIHELQCTIHGQNKSRSSEDNGWSQAKTAEIMGKSVGAVSEALLMNKALKDIPALQKCRDASEAKKMLQNMTIKMNADKLSKAHQQKIACTPLGIQRSKLTDAYIVKDFFDGVSRIDNESFDFVELDPPYGIDLRHTKKRNDQNVDLSLQEDYNEIALEQYPYFLERVLKEAYRVLKPSGWIVCWFAHEPWFDFVYHTLHNVGFIGNRMVGMWKKQTGQTKRPELYLPNVTEMFFYMRKGNTAQIQRPRVSNVFEYPAVNPQKKIHPTERPIEMMVDILMTFCKPLDKVLVPFLGSGNTLLAATNSKLDGLGWDLTQSYKDSYVVRVHEQEPGYYSSYPNLEGLA